MLEDTQNGDICETCGDNTKFKLYCDNCHTQHCEDCSCGCFVVYFCYVHGHYVESIENEKGDCGEL